MTGSIIGGIKSTKCGWDGKRLDKGTNSERGHSHKELMKCLYKSNMELWKSTQEIEKMKNEIKALQEQLAHYIIKEQEEKEKTGIMDVKEPIEIINDKQLAKDLLEAESTIGESNGTNA